MDVDKIKKPATKRSKKDTSPRKKPLARKADTERFYDKKEAAPKRKAATADK